MLFGPPGPGHRPAYRRGHRHGERDRQPHDHQFCGRFYRALGFGRSIKTAFQLGCNQIALAGLSEQDIPQMVALHADPARITIPPSILQSGAHYGWALLTVIPLLVLLYFLLQILYRWGGINPGFLSFAVSLLSIVSLLFAVLGITSEWGKQTTGAMWDSVVGRVPQLRETRNIFVVACGLAGVVALGFYVGLGLARNKNARGLAAFERSAYREAVQALAPRSTWTRVSPSITTTWATSTKRVRKPTKQSTSTAASSNGMTVSGPCTTTWGDCWRSRNPTRR